MIISIWLTAVLIQIVIAILLASQFTKHHNSNSLKNTSISVVIAAHNEERNLALLLPKLISQKHSNFEIIVALDRCFDKSEEVTGTFEKVRATKIVSVPGGNDPKKYALTTAIDLAAGDWIVFLDADCIPHSNSWLETIAKEIRDDADLLIGFSPYKNHGSLLHHFIQFEAFITAFNYLSASLLGHPYMAVGRNMSIRRSFFEETGGYADFKSVTGGDDDLFIQKNAKKSNTRIFIGKESLVYTEPKHNWKEYIHQKTRHLSVGAKYSLTDQLLHLLFNGTLLITWLLIPFISLEIILPIILFYLSVKGIGYRFAESKMGAGFNYILLPLVDLMHALILPIIAIRSKLVKDIRWKN